MVYVLIVPAGLVILYLIYFRYLIHQAAHSPLFHREIPQSDEGLAIKDFTYKEGSGFPWNGRFFSASDGAEDRPCVVFYHGEMPDFVNPKPMDWKIFDDYGRLMASKGYASVIFNHRSSKNVKKAGPPREDLKNLLDYIRKEDSSLPFDRNNISIWSFSGGPYICLNWVIKEKPDYIKKFVSYYGVLEGKEEGESAIELINHDSGKDLPPMLIVKAEKDRVRSSIKAAEKFFEAAKGKTKITLLSHRGPHGFDVLSKTEETIDIIDKTIDFIGE